MKRGRYPLSLLLIVCFDPLGRFGALGSEENVIFPDDPRRLVPVKFILQVEGEDDQEMSLEGQYEKKTFEIKGGSNYHLVVEFYVQRGIVPGIRLYQKTERKGVTDNSESFMVGSYGPRSEAFRYTSPVLEAPSGLLFRGAYTVTTRLIDDDKNSFDWQWTMRVN